MNTLEFTITLHCDDKETNDLMHKRHRANQQMSALSLLQSITEVFQKNDVAVQELNFSRVALTREEHGMVLKSPGAGTVEVKMIGSRKEDEPEQKAISE